MPERRSRHTPRAPGSLPAPRKRLGQHFLVDRHALERIADALSPTAADTVVEIGPGRGALTDLLVQRAGRVVAIELDRDLIQQLRARYDASGTTQIIEGDVLDRDLAAAGGQHSYLLDGTVPYYLTTPILFRLAKLQEQHGVFYDATLMVQREVADRLAARPRSKDYGVLTVCMQLAGRMERLINLPPGASQVPP